MKKLLSDGFIAGLKKIPIPVWYLFFALSAMFSDLYSLVFQGKETLAALATMFTDMPEVNFSRVLWIYYPLLAVIEVVIFELIVWAAYSILYRRSFITLSLNEFAFRTRFLMIIANVVSGLFALIYFALPEASSIISNTVSPLTSGLLLIFMLQYMVSVYVVPTLRKKSFLYMARLYLGISLAFAVFFFINSFIYEEVPVLDIIGGALGVVSVLILVLVAYLAYKKIPLDGGNNKDDDVFKVVFVEPEEKVFRDFDI